MDYLVLHFYIQHTYIMLWLCSIYIGMYNNYLQWEIGEKKYFHVLIKLFWIGNTCKQWNTAKSHYYNITYMFLFSQCV